MSQMATAINRLEAQVGGKLPSQPEANPKNVSAMMLRSGKEVETPKKTTFRWKRRRKLRRKLKNKETLHQIQR